ncbi:MAG: hypothetical protein ABI680_14865, partial [Chthoniobacteraceae bacterium]
MDVSVPSNLSVAATIALEDPTPPTMKSGRIAFETASASTTGTFSCASCHPNGHTDQLLWVLKTPVVTGGDQIMPRSTMPIRGLRDTEPYHWDGIPGDPYGGINSASIHANVPPNSRADQPESSTRNLIDAGLTTTMSMDGDKTVNDEGKAGALTAAQRDALAEFLLSVPYPPAQKRAYTNVLSSEAKKGFELFHIKGDLDPSKPKPNVCGDCHRMPFLVSTNTPGTGMDAPTWRGAYDRWLILPQGRLNIIDFDFYQRVAERGTPERSVWQFSWGGRERFDPVWDMVLEGSTGYSGAFARQVTLNRGSAGDALTGDLLDALEQSAHEGAVMLQGEGAFLEGGKATPVSLQFEREGYVERSGEHNRFTRGKLLSLAAAGRFVGTFTARLGATVDYEHPQPALWTLGPIEKQRGHQRFPTLFGTQTSMTISGRHIGDDANIIIDGRRSDGVASRDGETVSITLPTLPADGMHFLQVQNRDGLFSNDFIFHVADKAPAVEEQKPRSLGEVLSRSKWDRLIGTWVDADTRGAALKTTYTWKIKDRVIEVTDKKPQNESVSLMSLDATKGVFQIGGDSQGATFLGKWELMENGDAILGLGYTTGDGKEGTINLRYHLELESLAFSPMPLVSNPRL